MSAPKVLQLKNFFRSTQPDFINVGNKESSDIRSGECKAVIFPVTGYIDDFTFDLIKINMLSAPRETDDNPVKLLVAEWEEPNTHTILGISQPIIWNNAGIVSFKFDTPISFKAGKQVRLFFTKTIPDNLNDLWNTPQNYCCFVNIQFDFNENYDPNCKYFYGGGWTNQKYLILAEFIRTSEYISNEGGTFVNELISAMQINGQSREEVIQNIIDLNNNTFVVADENTQQN